MGKTGLGGLATTARTLRTFVTHRHELAPAREQWPIRRAVKGSYAIQEVKLVCHDWKTHLFHSALFRYEDRAEIHYSAHSNLCWRRFAICKEAMHLLIDTEPRHFTTDAPSLIERMIIGGELEPNTSVESEWMGEAAAIEILLPWQLRTVIEDMSKAGETDYQIAVQARTPLKYVTAMLRGEYGKASKGLHQQLDETDSIL